VNSEAVYSALQKRLVPIVNVITAYKMNVLFPRVSDGVKDEWQSPDCLRAVNFIIIPGTTSD
jgi:hypothetical protein